MFQAAIKALSPNVENSKTVYDYCRYLDEIAEGYDIHIVWLPGRSFIPGNCKADELAGRGTTIELSVEFSNLGILRMRTCKLIIDNAILDSVNASWAASDTARKI